MGQDLLDIQYPVTRTTMQLWRVILKHGSFNILLLLLLLGCECKQIPGRYKDIPVSLHACANYFDLPYNKRTMV